MTPFFSSGGKAKDTVRQRKKTPLVSTQRYLPISEIRSDTIFLKNGGIRAVLEVEALNFNLKSETEQKGIIAGYGSFVNTLTFPLQIVVRSTKTDIDVYLADLRAKGETQKNDLLKQQIFSYAEFVEKVVDIANIMQKRFYVVVPVDQAARQKTLLEKFFGWLQTDDSSAKALQRGREFGKGGAQLQERIELVRTGLLNVGLPSHRLTTRELIELYYQIYNPHTSKEQKLPKEEGKLNVDQTTL